jgi:hypothetical protein
MPALVAGIHALISFQIKASLLREAAILSEDVDAVSKRQIA